MPKLSLLDQRLLTLAQTSFPLCPRPWAALGESVDEHEDTVMLRLLRLSHMGVLREISAIFDGRTLGYESALVAAKVPDAQLEGAAAFVSAHPGVSHNYQREHDLNLWFTLATPPGRSLREAAARLAAGAGLTRHHVLPALKTFRIGVAFDLVAGGARALTGPEKPVERRPADLGPQDRAAVRVLQQDLPWVPRPFLGPARALDWSEEDLFNWMADAGARGILRRFAAVLRHREAGFGEGGMGVWEVAEDRVEALGRAFAQDPGVTHCYQRPTFEGWPYNLFTMVHGRRREDCVTALDRLAASVHGWTRRSALFSVREFKKERTKYFLEDFIANPVASH